MDIQALEILSNLAAITTKQGSGDAEVVSGDFSRLLNEINTMQSVSDMQEEICKKFNVTLHVVDYACNTTDQTAENFDLAMLDSGKFYGAGNVVISKKSLLRMQTDSRFRQKVYESIEGLGCTSKMTGGIVKSTGVFIHEDGKVEFESFVKKQSIGLEKYIRHHLDKFQISERMLKSGYIQPGEQFVQLRCMREKLKGK